ncbi:hypothetical protein GCM10007231_00490 [Nocardioides daphniae]|uniref:Uncharacterized protein n=1 Tax=Nocardioides daphniae TaxID=402297 RepID=A0ABQ1PXA4_9ACTN|nr:hypothetical protein GCM10007231_00490 [Nocardioides daphniae]
MAAARLRLEAEHEVAHRRRQLVAAVLQHQAYGRAVVAQRARGEQPRGVQRVADDAEVGQQGDAQAVGDHQLAEVCAVGAVCPRRQLAAEEPAAPCWWGWRGDE